MAVYVAKVVILEHPMFLDRYTIGKVTSQTSKTIQVIYWNITQRDWNDHSKRRNIGWTRILGSVEVVTPEYIQEMAEYLSAMYQHLEQTRTAALKQYNEAIHALGTKE